MMTSMRGIGAKCGETTKPGAMTCLGSWVWGKGDERGSWKRHLRGEDI